MKQAYKCPEARISALSAMDFVASSVDPITPPDDDPNLPEDTEPAIPENTDPVAPDMEWN